MMTDNELDNLFKNTFTNHEAPIPDDMWQRIQPGGAKKRPVVLWWKWYAAAAIFLIAGMAAWWYADTAGTNSTKATAYSKSATAPHIEPATTGAETKKNAAGNTPSQNTTSGNTTLHDNTTTNRQSATDRVIVLGKQPATVTVLPATQQKQSFLTPDAVGNKPVASNTTNLNNSSAENGVAAPVNGNNLPTYNANNGNTAIAQAPDNAAVTKQDTDAVANKAAAPQNTTTANSSKSATAINKNDSRKVKSKTLEWYISSAYARRQTYDVVKENSIGMAAPIPQKEPKPTLWNYAAGVRLGIPVAKKLILKTGVQFEQTRQQADYQQQNLVDMLSINGPGEPAIRIYYNAGSCAKFYIFSCLISY